MSAHGSEVGHALREWAVFLDVGHEEIPHLRQAIGAQIVTGYFAGIWNVTEGRAFVINLLSRPSGS